jgi:hypothetical protein
MTPDARPHVLALFAPSDAERVAPVLAALRGGGVAVAESAAAADPAARVLFFASGESTSPGPLVRAALDARKGQALVGVVLDAMGEAVLVPWALPVVLDARTGSGDSLARTIRALLPKDTLPLVPPPAARPKLFVSYAGADQPFVTRLTAWLVTQGWEPWAYQTSERDRRYKLHRELGEVIARSAAVLFVLTPDWVKSANCQDELDTAAGLRMTAEYLVVRKCDLSPIKKNVYSGGALRIDFTADESAAFRLLADRLKQLKAAL